jgi:hypothetical protein
MTQDEEEVLAAAKRFYDAIEHMATGKGLAPMHEAWHQTSRATTSHPIGGWAYGWDEILATWGVFDVIGRESMGGNHFIDMKVFVYGDTAYTTCIFVAGPLLGSAKINCTNIFQRVNGAWKVIHHHPDQSPTMAAAIEKIASE